MTHETAEREAVLTRNLLWLMAIASGITVANLYYNQPLLAEIGRTFQVSPQVSGLLAMLTQAGYAAGMLLVVPLGDAVEKRRLTLTMVIASALALCAVATSRSFLWIALASFAVGAASIVPQLLVPFAAYLADARERGQAVGTVMSGLLIGILLARTVSGTVGQYLGWRAMYWIAAGAMVILAILLRRLLPVSYPREKVSYGALMKTLLSFVAEHGTLREASFTGAMLFGAFSAFWATLAFRLQSPPLHYGTQAAGMFGLVGVVGAAAASLAGRFSDVHDRRAMLRLFSLIVVASYVVFWLFGNTLVGLALGVIPLDAGVQGGHVTNQSRIYALAPESPNRVNAVYMVSYFIGGGVGSAVGSHEWQERHWAGVCITGMALMLLGLAATFRKQQRTAVQRANAQQEV